MNSALGRWLLLTFASCALVSLLLLVAVNVDSFFPEKESSFPSSLNSTIQNLTTISKSEATISAVYDESDLLIAFSVHAERTSLVRYSRTWRRGVRAHILVDQRTNIKEFQANGNLHNETFTVVPDYIGHPPSIAHVLAPMFALKAVSAWGGFKWLLLGDADTIFSIPAVLRFLNDYALNADDPHMLSDLLVDCDPCTTLPCPLCRAPVTVDPRCQPCPEGTTICPCRLYGGCAAAAGIDAANCPIATHISAYGGTGIMYSVGMLRHLVSDPNTYLAATFRELTDNKPYGDVALAELARLGGYGFTHLPPPPSPSPSPEQPPTPPIERYFGTYCVYNDARTPLQQAVALSALWGTNPQALRWALSFHVRTWPTQDFRTEVLPAYKHIAKVMVRGGRDGEEGRGRKEGGGKGGEGKRVVKGRRRGPDGRRG